MQHEQHDKSSGRDLYELWCADGITLDYHDVQPGDHDKCTGAVLYANGWTRGRAGLDYHHVCGQQRHEYAGCQLHTIWRPNGFAVDYQDVSCCYAGDNGGSL